ncbi:sulfurtransferase [Facklamia miroungae]|uniref:thiosulfate sulfurtransferase n=1 Tax=Facklamia miroungae TaxID=120956 RepID=A0A1G7U415_9LACT|nr:rhodanese-like domain-containing protein [Facklamia miroungae]NKZ29898.1 sulfurtransferase [Facklamia miroungae]SDG42118.1 thiosulfate/3-mercaptopyruvate sulfurtransferase [Facklamia miroungae]
MKKFTNSVIFFFLSCILISTNPFIVNATNTIHDEVTAVEEAAIDSKQFSGDFIVDVDYLASKIYDPSTIIIDTRGTKEASKGHVPGALAMTWQDLADVEDKKPGEEGWGHILAKKDLAKKLGELGIDPAKEIILYSVANAGWGDDGRILWVLKAAGYQKLKMVDGGFQAISKSEIELDKGNIDFKPVEVSIDEISRDAIIDTQELTESLADYKIIDTREKDEYEGATYYGEAKGGHIPGAINIPYTALYNENDLLKSNKELEALFLDEGLNKEDAIVTYCTGGIRSAYMQLIMEMLGFKKVKNYEGSYYNWATINEVEK